MSFGAGSSADNAVVLTGSDLAPEHFTVTAARLPWLRIVIGAVQGPVQVNGRTLLQPGQWTKVRSPVEIEAGSQRFLLQRRNGVLWPVLILLVLSAAAVLLLRVRG